MLIESERRLFLELLVNNFMQISVERNDQNRDFFAVAARLKVMLHEAIFKDDF